MTERILPLAAIELLPDLQPRTGVDEALVAEYTQAYKDGATMPPLAVTMLPPARLILTDGWHRHPAALAAGIAHHSAIVTPGTLADAAWSAAGANQTHGKRPSAADRRRAAEIALAHRPEASDRAVAALVGLDHRTIADVRAKMRGEGDPLDGKRVGQDGKTYPPRPTAPPAPKDAGADSKPPPAPPAGPEDGHGYAIPKNAVPFWNERETLRAFHHDMTTILADLRGATGPRWKLIDKTRTEAALEVARAEILAAVPAYVCPFCSGAGCKPCRGTGLISEFLWRTIVPAELKNAVTAQPEGTDQ